MISAFRRPRPEPSTASRTIGRLRQAIVAAGVGYAGAVVAFALLRPLLGAREGWIELADDLEPWAYAPAPALGLLAAPLASGGLAAAGAAMVAAFGLRWGHRFLRRSSPTATARAVSDLTVMTFNTLAWQREGRDLEASIASADPDVVGLQEIGPRAAAHLVKAFADRLPYHYVTESATSSGAAVLSKYPIRDPINFRASERGHWWQKMSIESPFGPITYLNIHTRIPHIRATHRRVGRFHLPLEFHAERRRVEVRKLLAILDEIDGPVIVGGDFNMTERSHDHRLMSERLHDAYKAVGAGFGHSFPRAGALPHAFPAPWPTLRLDYVWHSRHLESAWAYRGDAGRSDHHPIVVGLRWARPAAQTGSGVPLAASAV